MTLMVAGEAGQGIQSMSFVIGKALLHGGYELFIDQDFESRIRGGRSSASLRIADRHVQAVSDHVDVLLALNADSITAHKDEMGPGGLVIGDAASLKVPSAGNGLLDIPAERLAVEKGGNRVMSNTVAVGAFMGLMGGDYNLLVPVLQEEFRGKADSIIQGNLAAARAGYDYAAEHFAQAPRLQPRGPSGKLMMTGHEGVSMGALAAGCKFVAGYPMTPTTSILEHMAQKGRAFGVVSVQSEDEISAANMAVGAAFAGARAMTATSGSGFALMTEALGLAAMTETPVVFILGQRPGPAVGLPTRTEQGDLEFALYGGPGGFHRPVLAPGSAAEAFWLTFEAFNIAERYQTPVIVLTDHDLADCYSTVEPFDLEGAVIDRGALISDEAARSLSGYRRFAYTDSNISPRALPGQGDFLVMADADEHNEDGHLIEDAATRAAMVQKRHRKFQGLVGEMAPPTVMPRPGAEFTLVGWGSTLGAMAEAAELLEKEGTSASVLHLSGLWPFPRDEVIRVLAGPAKACVVENNYTGQLARLIRAQTGIGIDRGIRKYDGRPFSPRYIVDALKKEVR